MSTEVPISVLYPANSLTGPSVATYKISPLDTQETKLSIGQEVASPVLTMVHSPGSLFTDSISVKLPVNSRINEWYAAKQQAELLSSLEKRRTGQSEQAHPKVQLNLHRAETTMYTNMSLDSSSSELILSYVEMLLEEEADVRDETSQATVKAFINTYRRPSKPQSSSSGRRASEDVPNTYTQLLLHWFNSKTLTWLPLRRGSMDSGNTVSVLPPSVLNDPAFSGKVVNLLSTTTDPPELPECGEFKDLVAGRPMKAIIYNIYTQLCMYVCMHVIYVCIYIYTYMYTYTYIRAGKCQMRPCKYTATLYKLSPAECLGPGSCHVICATAGWCIHDNPDGNMGLLLTRYKGTECICPTGVVVQV